MANPFEGNGAEPITSQIGADIEVAHNTVAEIKEELESLHFKRMNVVLLLNEIQGRTIRIKGGSKRANAQKRVDEALLTALRDYDAQYASLEEEYEEAKQTVTDVTSERGQLN